MGNGESVTVELAIEADSATCAALALNGFPFVRSVVGVASGRVEDTVLTVAVDGHPRCTISRRTGTLSPTVPVEWDISSLRLPLALMQGATERRQVDIVATMSDGNGNPLASAVHRLSIAPESHWPGVQQGCASLAAFVTPNSPALAPVLRDVSRRLAAKTGDGALDGYLSGRADRVQRIAESCYEAVAAFGIQYVVLQASFEAQGQKVRTPDEVFSDRLGNCLDISVTLAAVMEASGLWPMVIVGDGHAVVAFATVDSPFPDTVHDGASRLENRRALGEARVIEATVLCGQPASFGEALRVGERWIADAPDTVRVIDIRACRIAGIHPMPEAAARGAMDDDGPVEPPSGDYRIVQPADLPPIPKSRLSPKEARLESWKKSLLDLTLRNRLLNDTPATGIPLEIHGEGALAELLAILGREKALSLRASLDLPTEKPESSMVDELRGGVLRSALGDGALFQKATKAYRDARSSLEETGARSLYVAVGFLEFRTENKPAGVRAPLLLVPAAMERISRSEGFRVRMVPEDAVVNVALVEYLRITQGLDLGISSELLSEERPIAQVLAVVRNAVKNVEGARVLPDAKLGNYSFRKLPLFEEMRLRAESLSAHPIVSALLDRDAPSELRRAALVDPGDVEQRAGFASLHLPLPADSSQVAAVLSATDGCSFVLQGPPGTGKSQTITNLLVECLARGLRVLFVAEKGAALEVVSQRLRKTGLGAFALDLHADNATKPHFVAQIKSALEFVDGMAGIDSGEHATVSGELDRLSERMRAAGTALHGDRGGLEVFQAIDRCVELAATHPAASQNSALCDRLETAFPPGTDIAEREQRLGVVERLAAAVSGVAPGTADRLADFAPSSALNPEEASRLSVEAGIALLRLEAWRTAAVDTAAVLGLPSPQSLDAARRLRETCDTLCSGHIAEPWLASVALAQNCNRQLDACASALRIGAAGENAEKSLSSRFDRSVLELPLDRWAGDLRIAREKPMFVRWLAVRPVRSALSRLSKFVLPKDLPALLSETERLQAERDAIAAAKSVEDLLREFRSGSGQLDFDAASDAVAQAVSFAALVRRNHATNLGELAAAVPLALSQGRVGPARETIRTAERAWSEGLGLLAPCGASPSIENSDASFAAVADRLSRLQSASSLLPRWSTFTAVRHEADSAGLRPVADALIEGALRPVDARPVAEWEMMASWVRQHLRSDPDLSACASDRMEMMRVPFRGSIERYRRAVPQSVASKVRARARQILSASDNPGLRAAMNRLDELRALTTIRRPIRKVVSDTAPALLAIKPLVLASPLTASTLLPPDFPLFDLVVFDEASQVPVWDAACAITRGRSCVIVGDSRQLPPTRFFDRRDASEGAGGTDDALLADALEPLDSVLEEAIASGIPQQSLLWHYRSKDERLIEFSNRRSYGARLKTFPASRAGNANLGVEFRYVGGVYDRAGSATNRSEAEAVVAEIRRRLLDPDPCPANRSIGVVTFSVAQQTLVQDLLDDALDNDTALRAALAAAARDSDALFVKNLENVQGDERATMLFSVCYGRDRAGKLHYQFGPLNLSGGERRLNVAVSRAREKVVVFASVRASELDPAKCQAQGTRDLRDYLAFAEQGTVPSTREESPAVNGLRICSMEQRLARRLEARGFRVGLHVGRSQDYRVSLALARPENPDVWLAGVELDGTFLRSAPSVVDREVVRTGVLANLGWKIVPVSAVDIFRDEDAVVERVVAAALA